MNQPELQKNSRQHNFAKETYTSNIRALDCIDNFIQKTEIPPTTMLEAKKRKMVKSTSRLSRISQENRLTNQNNRYNRRLKDPIPAFLNIKGSLSPIRKSMKSQTSKRSLISKNIAVDDAKDILKKEQ